MNSRLSCPSPRGSQIRSRVPRSSSEKRLPQFIRFLPVLELFPNHHRFPPVDSCHRGLRPQTILAPSITKSWIKGNVQADRRMTNHHVDILVEGHFLHHKDSTLGSNPNVTHLLISSPNSVRKSSAELKIQTLPDHETDPALPHVFLMTWLPESQRSNESQIEHQH